MRCLLLVIRVQYEHHNVRTTSIEKLETKLGQLDLFETYDQFSQNEVHFP